MDWTYVIGPAIGALIGGIYGSMMGGGAFHSMRGSGISSRVGGSSGWTTGYIVLGALWGISLAFAYRQMQKKGGDERGEFLTETKAYKKKMKKQDKTDQKA